MGLFDLLPRTKRSTVSTDVVCAALAGWCTHRNSKYASDLSPGMNDFRFDRVEFCLKFKFSPIFRGMSMICCLVTTEKPFIMVFLHRNTATMEISGKEAKSIATFLDI